MNTEICLAFSHLSDDELMEVDGGSTKVVGAVAGGVSTVTGIFSGLCGLLGYETAAGVLAGVSGVSATVSTVCLVITML